MNYTYLLLGLLAFSWAGCAKLSEDPESFISSENFYRNEADALAAINGVYDMLTTGQYMYNNSYWWPADMSADDMRAGDGVNNPSILQIDQYTLGPVNDRLELLWEGTYIGINRANAVLARVPQISMDSRLKERITGEARFLRALFYFNLVRFFGDVPFDTTETTGLDKDLALPRTGTGIIYGSIVRDLTLAAGALEPGYPAGDADVGRATAGAALALLSKVYLTREQWQQAADAARAVIDLGVYGLLPDYGDAFRAATKNSRESIFAAQFESGYSTEGSNYFRYTAPRNTSQNPVVIAGGYGSVVPTQEFVDSYRSGDKRKAFIFTDSVSFGGKRTKLDITHIHKFFDETVIGGNMGDANVNYPILRYAELLLIYAEALEKLGRQSEATEYLNEVRRRAYGLDTQTPAPGVDYPNDLDAGEGLDLREAILKERRWELAFEGKRWFDLVRTGRLVQTLQAKGNQQVKPFHVLFPIPQREIDANPRLVQNPGYH